MPTLEDEISIALREYDASKNSPAPRQIQPSQPAQTSPSEDPIGQALASYDAVKSTSAADEARYGSIRPDTRLFSGSRLTDQLRRDSSWLFGPTEMQQRTSINEGGRGLVDIPGRTSKWIPTPSSQTLQSLFSEGEPGTAAKITSGVLRGGADAIGPMVTLGPLFGAAPPLLGRGLALGIAADIGANLPDSITAINQSIEAGDIEGAAANITGTAIGTLFGALATKHALSKGAAAESPMLTDLLTKKVKEDLSPAQMKEVYSKVNRGEGTEAEQELVRFVNQNIGAPGQAVRRGVTVTEATPRINDPWFNEWMGIKPKSRSVSLSGVEPVSTEKTQPVIERLNESTDQVRQQQPEVRPVQEVQTQPVPTVQQEPEQVAVQVEPPVDPIGPKIAAALNAGNEEELNNLLQQLPSPENRGRWGYSDATMIASLMEGNADLGRMSVRGVPVWKWVQAVRDASNAAPNPTVAENATVQPALTPPVEAQQISAKNGRPLVPMTGPDNQTHWFTFDGYQELARDRTEPSFTLVSQEPAPGLTQGGTFYPRSLAGYKPLTAVPTIEEWNARQDDDASALPSSDSLSGSRSVEGFLQSGFGTSALFETAKDKPFKIKPAPDGTLPGNAMLQSMPTVIPLAEWNILKDAGIEGFLKDRNISRENLAKWLKENGPQIEVKKLDAIVSSVDEQRRSEITHWRDSLPGPLSSAVTSFYSEAINRQELRDVFLSNRTRSTGREITDNDLINADMFVNMAVEYSEISNTILTGTKTKTDSATSRYTMVNPKPLDQMPGAVDLLVRIPLIGAYRWKERGGPFYAQNYKFKGPHFGDSDENVVASVRGYFETLQDGSKSFHVFEVQSDWAQEVRKRRGTAMETTPRGMIMDDPLLRYYNELAIKAAIKHAIDNGATHIALSDAETAMITEQHDLQPRNNTYINPKFEDAIKIENGFGQWRFMLGDEWTLEGDGNYIGGGGNERVTVFSNKNGDKRKFIAVSLKKNSPPPTSMEGDYYGSGLEKHDAWLIPVTEIITPLTQESGMRLNYDQILPRIIRDLTGNTGSKINFGPHQNADNRKEKSVYFKNPDGTPKTDITARLYSLDNVSERLAERGGFTLFSPKASFSGSQSRTPSPEASAQGVPEIRKIITESNLPENTKAVFIDMLSQPVMQRPEFSELTVALKDRLAVGGRQAEGIARVARKLIEISTSKADEKALPHELFHFFYEMLSPNDQALISRWRLQEIQEKYGNDAPAILVSGNMKSRQAVTEGIPQADYHLINDTEFLAGKFGRQFAEESTARNNPDRDTLLNKIKVWIQELWNAIKRRFKNEPEKVAAMQQMYEGILSGKILNTPQGGIKFEESASLVKDGDDAINQGKLQQTAAQQLIEGRHQVAQSADIVKAMEKFGIVSMDPEVQAKLRYDDFVGIQASGENLLGTRGDDYRSIKRGLSGVTQTVTPTGTTTVTNSKLANPYQITWTARIAGSQMRGFDMTMTDVIAQRDAKEKEVTAPSFINLMLKEMDAQNRTNLADQNTDLMNSVLDTAIAKAEKALRTEAKNERQIDEIKGQIREMNEARNSSVAMHQLVDDMVNVLSRTPEGFNLLTDPNFGTRTDIAKVYSDLKSSTGQPIHSPTLVKWATFVLQRNKRLLNNFTAASMSTQAPIRAAMTVFENDLTNQLKKSPAKTIKEIRRGTTKMVTEKERAKFAWKVLNKKVMDKLDEYNVLAEAAEVAEQIKADPDFIKLNKEIQTDSGGLGYQQPFEPFIHDTILLPSGRELNVKADHSFANETTEFLARHKDIEAGIKELQLWLDPASGNLDNINYDIHARNLHSLDTYYTGMGLMMPSDKNNMFSSVFGITMGILNNVVEDIGGRPSYPLQKAVRQYASANELMKNWLGKWSVPVTNSRIKAMQSHKQKWGSFSFGNDLNEANTWYFENIGNPLKWSHNTQQGGLKIGDVLPSGEIVTKEDMDAMRMESEAGEELFKKGLKEFDIYAIDTLGGFTLFRNSLKPGENGTTRTYGRSTSSSFSDPKILQALEDTQSTDPAISGPAINTVLAVMDQTGVWKQHGKGWVGDRFFKTAKATVFDGPGGALTVMKNDANKFTNATAFMNEVANLTGYSFDEVKNILIPEWSHPIAAFHKEVQIEKSEVDTKPIEQKTAFTRSRNEAIAPFTFYEYGFRVNSSMTKFASGIQARSVDRVLQGMKQSKVMLQQLLAKLQDDIQNDARVNGPGAESRVMKTQAELNKNGENYDRYENLENKIRDVDKQIKILERPEFDGTMDVLGRVIYAITGPLLGAPSTARNILDGPRYIGWQADRLMGSHAQAHALSMWYGWLAGNFPAVLKASYGLGKATLKTLSYGPTVNLIKTLMDPNVRRYTGKGGIPTVRTYAKNLLGTWMEEISYMYNERLKDAAGIDGVLSEKPSGQMEADNRLIGSILSQGLLTDESFGRIKKFVMAPLGVWETFFVNPNKQLHPAVGDLFLNAGLVRMLRSSWGPLAMYEKQATRLADMYSKGFRPLDFANPDNPINEFASKEIFARNWVRWVTSPEDLRNAAFEFKRAGLDFQKLMLKLVEKRVNGDMTAVFMTHRETVEFANSLIATANKGGVANDPAFMFSKGAGAIIAKPFFGWPFRTLSDLNNLASWSTQVKGQKGKSTEALRFKQFLANSNFIMLPMLAFFGVAVSYGSAWAYRELKKYLYNQELQYPLIHEREGLSGKAKGWALEMAYSVPLIGPLLSMGLSDSTPRASMNPDFVIVQKAKDVIKYWGGVAQTGDITYKLPEFIMGMVPDSRIIVSRLPGFEGKADLNNAANLLRRYGPTDDLKPMGARAGVVATELTPYGDRMANAAIAGDMTSFKEIYDEAVEVATKLGKAKPEQTVKEMFRSRNPYDRVFKSKISDEEREKILAKATPGERALIEAVEAKFKTALESIGGSASFTSEQSESNRGGGSGGTGTRPRASAGGGLGAIGAAGVAGSIGRTTRARTGRGRTRFSSGRRSRASLRTPRGRTRSIRSRVPSARARSRKNRASLRGL